MCQSSHPPEGHRARNKRRKQSSISFSSLQSFSLLSSLTCVSFFSSHSPVILSYLYCRSCSVRFFSLHLLYTHHSSLTLLISSLYLFAFLFLSWPSSFIWFQTFLQSLLFCCIPLSALVTQHVHLTEQKRMWGSLRDYLQN